MPTKHSPGSDQSHEAKVRQKLRNSETQKLPSDVPLKSRNIRKGRQGMSILDDGLLEVYWKSTMQFIQAPLERSIESNQPNADC